MARLGLREHGLDIGLVRLVAEMAGYPAQGRQRLPDLCRGQPVDREVVQPVGREAVALLHVT